MVQWISFLPLISVFVTGALGLYGLYKAHHYARDRDRTKFLLERLQTLTKEIDELCSEYSKQLAVTTMGPTLVDSQRFRYRTDLINRRADLLKGRFPWLLVQTELVAFRRCISREFADILDRDAHDAETRRAALVLIAAIERQADRHFV